METRQKYQGLQMLRAVAAILVVYHHCIILLNERFHIVIPEVFNGASGVDIFFIISGFVMAISSRNIGPKTFLVRRVERIVPLYWLATTMKVVMVLMVPALAVKSGYSVWRIVASYLFLPVQPVLVVGWTLNYEMLFYALFAICLAMRWRMVPALSVFLCVVCFIPGYSPIALEFLGGVVLANMKPMKYGVYLLIAGFAVLLLTPTGEATSFRVLIWGIPAMAIVSATVWLEGKWKVPGWCVLLGDSSYSIYLFHAFVLPPLAIVLLRFHLGRSALVVSVGCAGIVLSAAFGVFIHKIIERPVMWLLRNKSRNYTEVVVSSQI